MSYVTRKTDNLGKVRCSFLITAALVCVAAATPRAPSPTVEKEAPAVEPKDLPRDDPADIALVKKYWDGGVVQSDVNGKVNADGNVTSLSPDSDKLIGNVELQRAVSRLRHVQALHSRGKTGDDILLAAIDAWPTGNLQYASFGADVSDDALAHLERFQHLLQIGISSNRLTDDLFRHLGKLENLNNIRIFPAAPWHPLKINGSGLKEISSLRKLEDLTLVECPIDDAGMRNLKGLNLSSLTLHHPAITDRGIEAIADMSTLGQLVIADTAITDEAFVYFARLPDLCFLSIVHGPEVKGSGLKRISAMKKLEALCLQDCPIDDAAMKNLKGMRLKHLNVARTHITDLGMDEIKDMTGLELLCVDHCGIGDAAMKNLKGKRLKYLDLSSTEITDRAIDEIKDITSLQFLYIRDTNVTQAALTKLNGISHLNLDWTPPKKAR